MKLEIGKFIRTPYGIRKIVNITKDDGYGKPKVRVIELDRHLNTPYKFDYIFYTDENVIKKCKASYNIIDILEEGDYVNGSKVIDISIIGKDKEKWVWVEQMEDTDNKYGDDYVGYNNEQIKSIVTKEQMEQMAYKVVE